VTAVAAIIIAATAMTAIVVPALGERVAAASRAGWRTAPDQRGTVTRSRHGAVQAPVQRVNQHLPPVAGSQNETLPFPPNPRDRSPRPGEVPSLYADGYECSTGCRPYGAEIGWPLAPFHRQHPLRAGLNELRAGSLHVAVDIQAQDGQAVYAVQPAIARVLAASGPDARVEVGSYIYWHITPAVQTGEFVRAFATILGRVMDGYGHMAFSELDDQGDYVNPLRPGGTVLEPYRDHALPVIGGPVVAVDGQVIVSAYSPQTFVERTTYVTPVLAPAGIAYRLYDSTGAAVTPLEWAFRGTRLLPWSERSLIYAPGAHAPGYACFATRPICVPDWSYRVAGGLAPPLPSTLPAGRYRLTIYAWDWVDNTTALDTTVVKRQESWQPIGHFSGSLSQPPPT
jgi:hypothetical protein